VAPFPYSTWKPTPGMVSYENIQFQLVDTPPLTGEYLEPGMADLIRRTEILAVVLDLQSDPLAAFEAILSRLENLRVFPEGFRFPPDLKKPPFIKKMMVLANKVDQTRDEEDYDIFRQLWDYALPCLSISVETGRNLKRFVEMIYEMAGIIRVFTKAPGKQPDYDQPFVMPRESTLEVLATRIHKDFVEKLKFARIWGKGVYDGQMVQRDYVLQEGDVVEMHT
jgi:ribosome-interacting GTPase 1